MSKGSNIEETLADERDEALAEIEKLEAKLKRKNKKIRKLKALIGNALKVKAETIMQCQLAVCEYCRASAESGQTTVHKCVAGPLKEMLNEVARQLYGAEETDAEAERG